MTRPSSTDHAPARSSGRIAPLATPPARVATALVLAVLVGLALWAAARRSAPPPPPSFDGLLADHRVAEAHDALWDAVRRGGPIPRPHPIPADYAYAFEAVWPARRLEPDPAAARWAPDDPALLVVLPDHGTGRVSVSFNADQSAAFLDRRRREAAATGGRWLVTAGYTSPLVWPAGAFVHDGRVRNPAPQRWDGLVLVAPDRSIRVLDATALQLNDRPLDLSETPQAWTDVLAAASRSRLTLFQQHLVVRAGRSAVGDQAPQRRALRRALLETRAGTVAVFDSTPDALSLSELADTLANAYGAWRAVNLDTGTYSVAERYRDGHLATSRSTLGGGVVLTSLLEIDTAQ